VKWLRLAWPYGPSAPLSCPVFFYSSQSSAAGPGGNAHAGEDVGLVGPDRAGGQTHGAGVGAG